VTGPAARPDAFRVLHVCTGNICRSPMAEGLTVFGLVQRGTTTGFEVSSAGTWGHTGSPMEPYALSTLAEHGIDGSPFRARELVGEHVATADLVLTATREHRAAAVTFVPRAAARTFTLREFARLVSAVQPADLGDVPLPERGRALVRAAAANRGLFPPDHPDDDDLSDPYHAPASQFVRCAGVIERALARPLDLLAGTLDADPTRGALR
jgi:protein-tyrosine phosphatase